MGLHKDRVCLIVQRNQASEELASQRLDAFGILSLQILNEHPIPYWMRCILFLTITIASLLVSSERVVGGPIGIRMDETIRLGSSYGLMVDMDTAFAQEETLGPIFRSQFQRFKDLTAENVANYTRTYPKEFWAFNNYLRYLYRDGLITANDLSEYRAASVVGLKSYLETQQAQWPTPSPAVTQPQLNTGIDLLTSNGIEPVEGLDKIEQLVEFQDAEESPAPIPTETPELDRFLEIAKDVASGKTIQDSVETKVIEVADAKISSEVQSYLSERYKAVRLAGRLFSNDGNPEINLGLLSSLKDTNQETLFGQINLTTRDDVTTTSAGIGYRMQLVDQKIAGINTFIDYHEPTGQTRASLGLEWQSTYVSLVGNRYFSLSDFKQLSKHQMVKPADGFDIYLELTAPDWPINVTYRSERWELGDAGTDRVNAFGLRGQIATGVSLGVEQVESSHAETNLRAKLSYTYGANQSHDTDQLPDPSLFESNRYRFVSRDYYMPLATKVINEPPIAEDSTITLPAGAFQTIDVSSLIADPDDDFLQVSIAEFPTFGNLVLNGKIITYQHNDNAAESDHFMYRVTEEYGGTDTGRISVTIVHPNKPITEPSSPTPELDTEFVNGSFEDDVLGGSSAVGWTIVDSQIVLGTTVIAGTLSPTDTSYPTPSSGDTNIATPANAYSSSIVSPGSEGTQALRLVSTGLTSSSFATTRGPVAYTDSTVQLATGDNVTFDWKAQNGEDYYDVFGYFVNETTDETFIVLNESGNTQPFTSVSFSVPASGAYRFVFVSGSYDESGGTVLGASLYLDNFVISR